MKTVRLILAAITVYLLIMFLAGKYLTDKLERINATGEPYMPSETSITQNDESLYIRDVTLAYAPVNVPDEHVETIENTESVTCGYTQDELNLIYAVVRQEAGPDYESALAVMSTVIHRLNDYHWSWCGDTVLEQLTHPGQYCYSIDDLWIRYLDGNVEDCVKQAVLDGLAGKTNHSYTCFRGYYVEGAEKIGLDNWYFYDY